MPLTLQIECPNCSANLQIQGEAGQSLQVTCAQCSETLAFTVPQATSVQANPVAPKQAPAPAQPKYATVRNAPVRVQAIPARPVHQSQPTLSSETYFRPAPQAAEATTPMNPAVIVAIVASIVGLFLVAFTIGTLTWLFKAQGNPTASAPQPSLPTTIQRDAYSERVATAPSVDPSFEPSQPSIANIVPSAPATSNPPLPVLPALSPEKVIDEYFSMLTTARSMQNLTLDARRQTLEKCDSRSETLLRQAIALPYRPTELQRDFEKRLEQWESVSSVQRIFDNALALDSSAELAWCRLLDRYMRAPFFGLSVPDDELPIARYVQYVRALDNAATSVASIHSIESAETTAVEIQESYEQFAQFLIDKVNLRVKEGTQIDHPVSEKVYQDLILKFDGEISRRWRVGKNYRIAMDNLRFAIAERNDSVLTDNASLEKAIHSRPKLALVSSDNLEGTAPSVDADPMFSDNPAHAPPPTTQPLAPLPDGFTSQNMTVDQRSTRTKEFIGPNTKRFILHGVIEFPEAAVTYARRMQIEDFFVDYRKFETVLLIRDDRSITRLAGEIDFGEVLKISLPNNEVEVRYQEATVADSE
jgi:hypothetical protein